MKLIKFPLLYLLVQIILIILFCLIFVITNNDISLFNDYFLNIQIYLVLILALIFVPILLNKYKKEEVRKNNIKVKDIIILITLGISLSICFNTIVFYINKVFPFTNLFDSNNNLIVTLISTGLIGPIIEELMFRGIVYNEAKKKYTNMKAILITNIIFALFHLNFVQMIYAFIIGFILIYAKEKYKNIISPIAIHMASNITSLLYLIILSKNYFWFNYIIFIISLALLFIIRKLLKNKEI